MSDQRSQLKHFQQNTDKQASNETIINIAPGLEDYVANRLRTARAKGLLLNNLDTPDDILDEVTLRVYEDFDAMPEEEDAFRIKLFQLANAVLDERIQEEAWQQDAISLEDVLADETRLLREIPQITRDADGDIVMVEDLDDAELAPPEPRALLLEDSFENELIGQIGLDRAVVKADDQRRKLLARFYQRLPAQSRIILDLWTRGKLSIEEIARVRGISVEQVRAILELVSNEFQRLLRQ